MGAHFSVFFLGQRTNSLPFLSFLSSSLPLEVKKVKAAHTRLPSVGFPGLISVLGSQPAGGVSHKPSGRLPLLSARPAVTLATLERAATNFALW